MASKLFRTIKPNTSLENVGRLKWFDPERSIFGLENNRDCRRVKATIEKQVSNLEFYDLMTLVEPDEREILYQDFFDLAESKGEQVALERVRKLIVQNFLYKELVRLRIDFTQPFENMELYLTALYISNQPFSEYLRKQLKRETFLGERRISEALMRLRIAHSAWLLQQVTKLPQVSPNAPNYLPAISLAAA